MRARCWKCGAWVLPQHTKYTELKMGEREDAPIRQVPLCLACMKQILVTDERLEDLRIEIENDPRKSYDEIQNKLSEKHPMRQSSDITLNTGE